MAELSQWEVVTIQMGHPVCPVPALPCIVPCFRFAGGQNSSKDQGIGGANAEPSKPQQQAAKKKPLVNVSGQYTGYQLE